MKGEPGQMRISEFRVASAATTAEVQETETRIANPARNAADMSDSGTVDWQAV